MEHKHEKRFTEYYPLYSKNTLVEQLWTNKL